MVEPFNPTNCTIECTSYEYANFLSSLVLQLLFGFLWGHISKSPEKLFGKLNDLYLYIVLPAMAIISFPSLTAAKHILNGDTYHLYTNIIFTDLITKGVIWSVVVLVVLVVAALYGRLNRHDIVSAALVAQFIIHGNDIGFSKPLLEASCHLEVDKNVTLNTEFMGVETIVNLMNFLIFLPLTHGLANRGNIFKNILNQGRKMLLSYICLGIGVVLYLTTDTVQHSVNRLSSFYGIVTMASTLQTIMCGMYIYVTIFNFSDWKSIQLIKTLLMTAMVAFVYPAVHYLIYHLMKPDQNGHKLSSVFILGHSSTPASIYFQYYLAKVTLHRTNYIAAFILSTFLGAIVMYVYNLDDEILKSILHLQRSPVDYYLIHDQWQFLLVSILLMTIFGVLIYVRIIGNQTKLRRMISIALVIILIQNMVEIGANLHMQHNEDFATCEAVGPERLYWIFSAIHMSGFICTNLMIALLVLYNVIPFVRRRGEIIAIAIVIISITVTAAFYVGTYLFYQKNSDKYCLAYGNIITLLDLRNRPKPDHKIIESEIAYPFSIYYYMAIVVSTIIIYIAVIVVKYIRNGEQQERDDEIDYSEKLIACKVMFGIQLFINILFISFGIRDINHVKNFEKFKNPDLADHILQFFELLCFVLKDLTGALFVLAFCITPGKMDIELERFMYYPEMIKQKLIKLTEDDPNDTSNMSLDDLNFCEKFNEKYRDKFLRIREVKADQSFQGVVLLGFLVNEGVAEGPGLARHFGNALIKGKILSPVEEEEGNSCFFENMKTYRLNEVEGLPNYKEIIERKRAST